jgi:hypothetical protein
MPFSSRYLRLDDALPFALHDTADRRDAIQCAFASGAVKARPPHEQLQALP